MSVRPRPAIQLYSLYDSSATVPELVRLAGAAGYEGVEFASRFRETDIGVLADALAEAAVEPVAVHADIPVIEAAIEGENDLFERCETVGVDRIVSPHPSGTYFRTEMTVQSLLARYDEIAGVFADHGMSLVHHTSRHEFWPLVPGLVERVVTSTPIPDGVTSYLSQGLVQLSDGMMPDSAGFQTLVAGADSSALQFEIDSAEVTAGGTDPGEAISLASNRVPLLHLRDIASAGRWQSYKDIETGEGMVDFDRVIEAAYENDVEWLIYEDEVAREAESKLIEGMSFLDSVTRDGPASHSSTKIRTSD